MNCDLLISELTRDEGLRLVVYDDATGEPIVPGTLVKGHPTIGIGRALDVRGITKAEAEYLNRNDVDSFTAEIRAALPWFDGLDDVRQRVLLNMCFNLGTAGLLKFKNTLRHIRAGEYEMAARGMESSLWFKQVGARAARLCTMMRTGTADAPPVT